MFRVVRKMPRLLPIFALASFAALPLLANGSATASENVTTNVTVEPSLTVTIPSTPITLNLNPASTTSGNNNITITVGTNNATGYKTVMTSRSGGTDLVDATDTSLVIPTLDTGTSYASLSTFPANHWGYKQDSGNYKPFETDTTILENSSYANVDTTTLNFATKIDYLQEAGAYSTTLVFNTTVNPIVDYMQNFTPTMCRTLASAGDYTVVDKRDSKEYTVRWINGNCWMTENLRYVGDKGSTSGSMVMKAATSNISADATTTYIDLDGNATYDDAAIHVGVDDNNDPTVWYNYAAATAMTIKGSNNTDTQTYDICPEGWRLPTKSEQDGITSQISAYSPVAGGMYYIGAHYQANYGMWWLSTSVNATMRYYLEWNKTTLTTNTQYRNNGLYVRCILQPQTMQSFSPADADAMNINETITLRDARDNKTYTVAKLADRQIWMTSNLNLAGDTVLSDDLSDVPTANYYTLPASSSSGFTSDSSGYLYNSGNETTSQSDCTSTKLCNSYYSWLVATAGGKDISGNAVTGNGYNAAYSICPKGWRLPTATTSNADPTASPNWKTGDIYKFATAYGADLESSYSQSANTLYVNAGPGTVPNVLRTGSYYDNSLHYGGSYGSFWSPTSQSSDRAYVFLVTSSSTSSASGSGRRAGVQVRCMFNDPRTISGITYMQDINPSIITNTTEGATATLIDIRDNKSYTVAKINGNIWMTQNLRFIGQTGDAAGEMTLVSSTSNVENSSPYVFNYYGDMTADMSLPRVHDSGNAENGAWYNYAAASVGTIIGASNNNVQVYDICPAGWHLPSSSQQTDIISYDNLYRPITGGYYEGSSLTATGYGYWWSSIAYNDSNAGTRRRGLKWNGSNLSGSKQFEMYRSWGCYIRCITK